MTVNDNQTKGKSMKNKLIPLVECSGTTGEYEPALIPQGYKYRILIESPHGGRWTRGDHQGFSWLPKLDGKIRNQCGPAIQLDDGGLFMIQDADKFLCAA